MRDRPHSEVMAEKFRADPAYAAELFAHILGDGSPAELAILLQQLAIAFGPRHQIQDAARKRQ